MKKIWHTGWGLDEWGWLAINLLLIAHVVGINHVIVIAALLLLLQSLYFYSKGLRWCDLKLQVRLAYALLLIIDIVLPWHLIHGAQIIGTTALLLFDYCFLARTMLLMPWNRNQGFSWALLCKAYLSPPVPGQVSL